MSAWNPWGSDSGYRRGDTRRSRDVRTRDHILGATGALDAAIRFFQEVGVPATRQERGYIQNLLLTDRETGNAFSISLWETAADVRASMAGHQGRVGDGSRPAFLNGAPATETYEVSVSAEL